MTKAKFFLIFLMATIPFLILWGLFVNKENVAAQTKQELCKRYAKTQAAYNCCMTHTLDTFMECFTAPAPAPSPAPSPTPSPAPKQIQVPQEESLFDTQEGRNAYKALMECYKTNGLQSPCEAYSKMLKDAFAKFNQCLDLHPVGSAERSSCGSDGVLDDVYNARTEAQKRFKQEGQPAGFAQQPSPAEIAPQINLIKKKLTGILDPLWGGLARPFDQLLLELPQVLLGKPHDNAGNEIPVDKLKDWKKNAPIVKFEFPIENLEKGKSVGAKLPQGLPVSNMVFSTAEPIKYADTEITIYDGATTPKMLRPEERGGPIEEEEEEEEIVVPDPKKYDISWYLNIKTISGNKEVHPFQQVLFETLPDYFSGLYRTMKMIRWSSNLESWVDLPANKEAGCNEQSCRMIVQSPGTSYFAFVVEKQPSLFLSMLRQNLFIAGLSSLMVLIIFWKRITNKKTAVIMLIVVSILTSGALIWNIASIFPISKAQVIPLKHLVTLKTTLGDIQFETYDVDAPKAVSSFISLAESDFYNDIIFHRVVKNLLIQAGDPAGIGIGGPGYNFKDDLDPTTKSYQEGYKRGAVALANAGPNTNESQFFIMLADDESMPHDYTIFGKVINGFDVIDMIGNLPTGDLDRPLDPPKILSVSVEEESTF